MAEQQSSKQHISGQYNTELESIKNDLLEMGGKVERQIELASEGLVQADSALAEAAIELDRAINAAEVEIDEQCIRILARRQPAASDLRLIISIVKITTDLERIGDEATKVARVAIRLATNGVDRPAAVRTQRMAAHVTGMLRQTLDAFARLSVQQAVEVVQSDSDIDDDYRESMAEIHAAMASDPDAIDRHMDLVWSIRSLERIGDHASNIAEQVVYLVRGVDIRHVDASGLGNLLSEDLGT